jgi:transposase, IS5 family
MKAHIGADSRTKLVHTVLAPAANVADCLALQYLLHGKERRVAALANLFLSRRRLLNA